MKDSIRERIVKHLRQIGEECREFEQTTHGCIFRGTADEVARAMAAAIDNPGSYETSTLSQAIRAFLKTI